MAPVELEPPVVEPEVAEDLAAMEGSEEEFTPLHDEPEGKALLGIVQEFSRQEQFVRETQMKKWRKHYHYWNGLQYLAWSEVAHDWMTADDIVENDPQADIDPALFAKVINVYKAHGEILIGALSSGLPAVRFFPKDADDHEDVMAAKARSRIAELIQRQNKARLLLMKALFIMYNEGVIFAYNENKEDSRFGIVETPEYGEVPVTKRASYCPNCGMEFGVEEVDPQMLEMEQMEGVEPQEQQCPQCGQMVVPEHDDMQEMQEQVVGTNQQPKNRECLEIYGGMNVSIPVWCKDQHSVPMLKLITEESIYMMKEIYPEIAELIVSSSYPDTYEKEMRVSGHYKNDFPRDLCTVERCWIRPWAYNYYEKDTDDALILRELYPDGVYGVVINGSIVAEILSDKLDDHWTISENPLSEVLHAEAIGSTMVPMQDITNELANITLETIEFGIPEIFADGRVLDFDAYQKQEARPGQISPANMPPGGQGLSSGFFEMKASTLSREVEMFADRIESMAQFIMGSYPSVYGGVQEGGGGTAREYEESKASALQRLSSTWLIIQEFWARVMGKAVQSFVTNMQEDEKFVTSKGSNFLNVWIRKAELTGEVGEVEPEISETFPISWAQKRDIVMQLIQMGNEDINVVIRHPENAGLIASTIGVPELYIPGDDDRNKQLYEISQLIVAEPMETMPTAQNPTGLYSSVPVTQELDNHSIEAEICRSWLKSEVGLDAKENNPGGYANVLAHLNEHLLFEQMMMAPAPEEGEEVSEEGLESNV